MPRNKPEGEIVNKRIIKQTARREREAKRGQKSLEQLTREVEEGKLREGDKKWLEREVEGFEVQQRIDDIASGRRSFDLLDLPTSDDPWDL